MLNWVRTQPAACPACSASLSGAADSAGQDAVPGPDDLTICLHCTAVLQFDAALSPRLLDDAALASLDAETRDRLAHWVRQVKEFQQWRKSKQS